MCTASHNPKAYTGAKLVERGAIALSGDRGIGDIRRLLEDGPARRARRRHRRGGRRLRRVPGRRAGVHRPDRGRSRCKVVLDGGNGMAGPDGRPDARAPAGLDHAPTYWEPDGEFPDHEPNPLLPENREFIIGKVRRGGRRPRHRLGRRRRPLLLHRRHAASSSTATSSPRCWPSRCSQKQPGRGRSSTTSAPRARSPTPSRRAGGTRARQPRRPRVLQDPHARRGRRRSAARSPATTTSPTSTTRTPARSRRC